MAGHGWRSKRLGGWGRKKPGVSSGEWGVGVGEQRLGAGIEWEEIGDGSRDGDEGGTRAEVGVARYLYRK